MDQVFFTPYRNAGVVPVAVPSDLAAKLRNDVEYDVLVRITERREGATVNLVALDELAASARKRVWTAPR